MISDLGSRRHKRDMFQRLHAVAQGIMAIAQIIFFMALLDPASAFHISSPASTLVLQPGTTRGRLGTWGTSPPRPVRPVLLLHLLLAPPPRLVQRLQNPRVRLTMGAGPEDVPANRDVGKGQKTGRRRAMLAIGAGLLSLASLPREADAAYGPAGASVRTNPLLKDIGLEQFLNLDPDVQIKIEKSLQGRLGRQQITELLQEIKNLPPPQTVDDFNKRLDAITLLRESPTISQAELNDLKKEEAKIIQERSYLTLTEKMKERRQREQMQQQLQDTLMSRQRLLDILDAQPAWVSYGAAAGGSTISTLIMHPLDTLKIRLQAKSGSSSHEKSDGIVDDAGHHGSVMDKAKEGTTGLAKAGSSPNQEPNTNDGSVVVKECKTSSVLAIHDDAERHEGSVVDAERHKGSVVDAERHEGSVMAKAKEATSGLVSLYNGVVPNIMKEAPSSAVYLGIYESMKSSLTTTPLVAFPLLIYLLSGATGELAGSVLRSPSEAIKINVQSSSMTASEATKYVLFDAAGRASTFKAWQATLFRDIPMGAIQIALFEGIKTYIIEAPDITWDPTTLLAEAVIGSFAGMVGAAISITPDLIITKINIESKKGRSVGLWEMGREIYAEQGIKGLTAGIGERAFYWGPAIGIFLSCYCGIRQYFPSG